MKSIHLSTVKVENKLRDKYGASAMSTYYGARYLHGFTALQSLNLMRLQIKELGISYPGGLECCKFRGKERINHLVN